MPDPGLRRATVADLVPLVDLEEVCFEPERRASRASLRRSLQSERQEVWVAEAEGQVVGCIVFWPFVHTVRLYGLAVHQDWQGHGLGRRLVGVAEDEAGKRGAVAVLEADADKPGLVGWYEGMGYRRVRWKEGFYAPGRAAWRMEKRFARLEASSRPEEPAKGHTITNAYQQPRVGTAMAWTFTAPEDGERIDVQADGTLVVPDHPIIPFIEGDGTGPDIWAASKLVLDAAVEKAYGGKRRIAWMEVLAGEKAFNATGEWLPEATLEGIRQYKVAIKGPLTTPVGGGIRSLNVALRQILDLYVCLRPVKYYAGVPSPVHGPERHDWVIFRENSEDIYAGVEFQAGTPEQKKLLTFLQEEMGVTKIRFPETSGLGIKPISEEGTKRLVRAAIEYAIEHDRPSVTLVHKGNIMKFTEGGFRDWGYELAKQEFGATELDGGPWCTFQNPKTGKTITVKDVIADAMLQQILTRPAEYGVVATMNLNGDYLSDALAACVGGIGIAPGANINYMTGHAIFEATHGTAPKYAGLDKVNPGSVILSGVMMLQHLGWNEAADMIQASLAQTILNKTVTYDFERMMEGATLLKCSEFGDALIENMAAVTATASA